MKRDDFLVEIHTEELPPKSLSTLAEAFRQQIQERLQKAGLGFAEIVFFATPRRLAVLVKQLEATQADQVVERKGPALSTAFDAQGKPSQACIGFARSCGVTAEALEVIKTAQGEWVGYHQSIIGKPVTELLPAIVEQAALALPIPKRMRWGSGDTQFVRPVHSVILLYGDAVIDATVLGCKAGRVTRGHRFLSPDWITIPAAAAYESLLSSEGWVMADVAKRREEIRKQALACLKEVKDAQPLMSEALLDEVTGLVEWPTAVCGAFDAAFLALPQEVLISAMQDHQRYFPVMDAKEKLLPYFVTISNITSHDQNRVVHGNERVLRARLADAAFFYATDKKESLKQRVERLKGIVYQAKLGTLYDKAERISKLAVDIAKQTGANEKNALQAGWLAKTDLTTNMVSEFPELQGVMGCYYAQHDGEENDVAQALKEQYMPRYAGDRLPANPVGKAVAIADRIDTLTGTFGINQIPTGDKDPYGLRRAALGVLRLLIEENMDLDLQEVVQAAAKNFTVTLENTDTVTQTVNFIQERLRAWYQDQGITPDVFSAVAALGITNLLDVDKRIKAVQAFKKLNEAEALSVANKRVSNILAKYEGNLKNKQIDVILFEHRSEYVLDEELKRRQENVKSMCDRRLYDKALLQLAELRQPIDNFFDNVMVMTEDKGRRENRILLLSKLRALFLQVADIALLQ
jgi:glycyl-tRNA synthetase beta chain